jgi:hypothetical protein
VPPLRVYGHRDERIIDVVQRRLGALPPAFARQVPHLPRPTAVLIGKRNNAVEVSLTRAGCERNFLNNFRRFSTFFPYLITTSPDPHAAFMLGDNESGIFQGGHYIGLQYAFSVLENACLCFTGIKYSSTVMGIDGDIDMLFFVRYGSRMVEANAADYLDVLLTHVLLSSIEHKIDIPSAA